MDFFTPPRPVRALTIGLCAYGHYQVELALKETIHSLGCSFVVYPYLTQHLKRSWMDNLSGSGTSAKGFPGRTVVLIGQGFCQLGSAGVSGTDKKDFLLS